MAIFILWGLILGLGRSRSREVIEHCLYRQFCMQLELLGVQRELHQSPKEFGLFSASMLPELASEINNLTTIYQKLCYECEEGGDKKKLVQELRILVKEIKWLVLKMRIRMFFNSYRFISE